MSMILLTKHPKISKNLDLKLFRNIMTMLVIALMKANRYLKQMMAGLPPGAKKTIRQLMNFKKLKKLKIRGGLI